MPTSTLGSWGANTALATLFNGTTQLYLGLHTSTPNVLDPSATEVAGMGYARQPIGFSIVSGRNVVSNTAQNFAGMPAATINFLGIWTQAAVGFLVGCIDISATPIVVLANGYVICLAGDIAFSL